MDKMNMKMINKWLWQLSLLMPFLFLSACVTYKLPENNPVAYLSSQGVGFGYGTVPGLVFTDPYQCRSPVSPTSLAKLYSGKPFPIAANRLSTVAIIHNYKFGRFFFTLTFVPKPNYHYFISLKDAENSDFIMATLTLLGDDGQGSGYHPIPFIKRAFGASDTYCLDTEVQDRLRNGLYGSLPKVISWEQKQEAKILFY